MESIDVTVTATRVQVIGRGRVGGAIAGRLAAQHALVDTAPDVVLLCVPDAAIAGVAARVPAGPWVGHVSGATPLDHLAPHVRRFSLHPLQTFTTTRGPDQLDGAWAAVTALDDEGRVIAQRLAVRLGLRPFDLADDRRALYHAGAVMASNFLVTLYRAAADVVTAAGAPPEALVPLMSRTIDNHFALTGPIARGDRATVEANLAALRRHRPDLERLYRVLAEATRP